MKLFGLIGFPLGHSFSKHYFETKFRSDPALEEYVYENFEIPSIDSLPDLIESHPQLVGFNVTRPYKESVMKFLDVVDDLALKAGAVNTVHLVKNNGSDVPVLTGFNTDLAGFKLSLASFIGTAKPNVLILGTGGASKAVALALRIMGLHSKTVSRYKGNGTMTYQDLSAAVLNEFRLIINTTPLGTYPNTAEKPPIPYQHLGSGHFLFDLVYNPPVTAFMEEGLNRGAHVKNGLEMLHLQAETSWEIWKGKF